MRTRIQEKYGKVAKKKGGVMAESTQPQQTSAQASFAERVQTFHGTLPPEEQMMLEQIFALAQSASQEHADVQGFAGDLPAEAITFNFGTIKWTYTPR